MESLSFPKLRDPKNIKLIKYLEITVSVEYDKFVHMKIKEPEKEIYKIPKEDIINKAYWKKQMII